MWGAPGTMLASLALYKDTGEQRWIDLYRKSAHALEKTFTHDPERGCRLWLQHLYGNEAQLIGAVHGFSGNAFALIQGRQFLDTELWLGLTRDIAATFHTTAMHTKSGVNWPQWVGASQPGHTLMLVQHCHGYVLG